MTILQDIKPPGEWVEQGLCAQTDPEAFFPEKGGSTREAKAVCRRCDVRLQCFLDVMETGDRFGIWAGYSERERRKLAADPGLYQQALNEITHTQEEPIMTAALINDPIVEVEPEELETDAVSIPKEDLPALVVGEDYYPMPEYIADMTRVLLITEIHPDPLVRNIRKIAVQAIAALNAMGVLEEDEEPNEEAAPEPEPAAPPVPIENDSAQRTDPRTGKQTPSSALLAQHGIAAGQVRAWAEREGIAVSPRGSIAIDVIQAYISAH